uniref:MotE family protein n=1 Tax=Acetatifactor sp. TaxID=1872090 RepID=UPI00405659BD
MAKEKTQEELLAESEKKQIQNEKKELKKQQREQKKEAKRQAKEIAKREEALVDEEESNGLLTFGATVLIVVLWIAVVCVIIKLDIGGFGSGVLTPILKDVPIVNRILPGVSLTETTDTESYGGYTSLKDAVEQIRYLELELERVQNESSSKDEDLDNLKAEVIRLKEFEKKQLEFQRIRTEFYEEVVYSDKGPGEDAFQEYFESMDPSTAEYIYKQVVTQLEESRDIEEYVATYSSMKPKAAAAMFETMTDNLDLVARILGGMTAEQRGDILNVMDPDVAGRLTKIMDPES